MSDQEKFPKLLPAGIPNLEYAHKSIKDIIAPFESGTSRLEYDPGEKVIRIKKGALIRSGLIMGGYMLHGRV